MVQKPEIDEKCCKWFETCYSTKGYNLLLHMVRNLENDQLMLHTYDKKLGEWSTNVTYGMKLDGWQNTATYGIKL